MLVHHGNNGYAEAATAAAANARAKMEALIEKGRGRATAVIEQIEREMPTDRIVRGQGMRFLAHDRNGNPGLRLVFNNGPVAFGLHEHAMGQAAERAGVPWKYIQSLRENGAWGHDLAAHNLTTIFNERNGRFLTREVGGEVRGILSDQFRRLDCRPIVDAFGAACAKVGAVPVEGYALETKIAIKALLPRVFEPVPNEVMAFGLMLGNSDFGDGALSLRVFMLRLWCTNYAITDEALRQVHLGGRLPDDVTFSDRTYRLDTDRSASMIRDLVTSELSAARVNQVCDVIRKADEEKVTATSVKALLDRRLGKAEAQAVTEAFTSAEVEMLPPGNSAWRLSNAISWIAGRTKNEHRRLELMQAAAEVLPGGGAIHAASRN